MGKRMDGWRSGKERVREGTNTETTGCGLGVALGTTLAVTGAVLGEGCFVCWCCCGGEGENEGNEE